MIELKNVTFSYNKKNIVINNLSFNLKKGQCLGILGANGAGKSTLVKLMSGFLRPNSGLINIFGLKNPGEEKKIRKNTSMVPQNIDHWLLGATVKEDLTLGLNLNDLKTIKKIEKISKYFNLQSIASMYVDELSLGQKKKLGLATALIKEPLLIFLDEPLAFLDWPTSKMILEKLKELKNYQSTVVLITHDPFLLKDLVDKWLILDQGTLVQTGNWEEVQIFFSEYKIRPF